MTSPSGIPAFADQVVLVTGAGHGLGRDYALSLASYGATVVVNDVGRDTAGRWTAESVAKEITDTGGSAVANHDSVAEPDGAAAMVALAVERYGRLDALVNNAGIVRGAAFEDVTVDDLDAILAVHVRGSFLVAQQAYRQMMTQHYGRIVNTSSAAGMFGMPTMAAYAAAKSAMLGLTNVVSGEGARYGIKINAVLPIAPTVAGRTTGQNEVYGRLGRLQSRCKVEYVTPLVVYLASSSCRDSGRLYSAVAGRYARVFTGIVPGWISDRDTPADLASVAANIDGIEDRSGYATPADIFEEVSIIGELVGPA